MGELQRVVDAQAGVIARLDDELGICKSRIIMAEGRLRGAEVRLTLAEVRLPEGAIPMRGHGPPSPTEELPKTPGADADSDDDDLADYV